MRKTQFEHQAFIEMRYWLKNDRKLLDRILRIIEEIENNPFEGIGKPEPLKGNLKGFWSRRINDEHRLLYQVTEEYIIIHKMKGHYDD
jgi:toxin YoeB